MPRRPPRDIKVDIKIDHDEIKRSVATWIHEALLEEARKRDARIAAESAKNRQEVSKRLARALAKEQTSTSSTNACEPTQGGAEPAATVASTRAAPTTPEETELLARWRSLDPVGQRTILDLLRWAATS